VLVAQASEVKVVSPIVAAHGMCANSAADAAIISLMMQAWPTLYHALASSSMVEVLAVKILDLPSSWSPSLAMTR
jgi:hypothetical protein